MKRGVAHRSGTRDSLAPTRGTGCALRQRLRRKTCAFGARQRHAARAAQL